MSEIWNLSALCRCCHSDDSDGEFKSLSRTYVVKNEVEIYSSMLRDTFGIIIDPPKPTSDKSYTICDKCIIELRRAVIFKKQVLICEAKFEEYCKNEESFKLTEEIKEEIESAGDKSDGDGFYENDYDADSKTVTVEVKDEFMIKYGKKDIKDEDKLKIKSIEIPIETDNIETDKSKPKRIRKPKSDKLEIESIEIPIETSNIETDKSKPKRIKKPKSDGSLTTPRSTITPEQDESCSKYITINKKTNSFSCKKCQEKFKYLYVIKRHILHKHLGLLFKCSQCDMEFKTRTAQYLHTVTHNPEYQNICNICGKVYTTKYAFIVHMNSHTKERLFECDDCHKNFLHKRSLVNHIKVYHLGYPKPQVICYICGHSFNDITNMKIHVQTVHEKLRPYNCEICSKAFSAKKHVNEHVRRVHTLEKPYACDKCDNAFVCSADLNKHKSRHCHKKTVTNFFNCKLCQAKFMTRGDLVRHSRTHAGSKPLLCHLCERDFSCKYALRRHIESHNGVKQFQCDVCYKTFSQKESMKRHKKRLHISKPAEKKSKCDICKRHVADLEKHVENHNNKPHGCDYCPKRYPERNALNRHIANIHFGRKAHACDLCDQKYVHPRSLRNHKLKVHKIVTKLEKEEVVDDYLPSYMIENKKNSSSDVKDVSIATP